MLYSRSDIEYQQRYKLRRSFGQLIVVLILLDLMDPSRLFEVTSLDNSSNKNYTELY